MAAAGEAIEVRQNNRFRLDEISCTTMTTDGSGRKKSTLEGLPAPHCLMDGNDHSASDGTGGNEKKPGWARLGRWKNGANGDGGSEGNRGETGDGGAGGNGYAVRDGGDPNFDETIGGSSGKECR